MYRKISGLIFMFILLCSELAFGKMCFMNLQERPVKFKVSFEVSQDAISKYEILAPGATGCLDMGSCSQNIKYKVVATVVSPQGQQLGLATDVRCFDSLYVQSGKLEHNKYHEHNEDTLVCPSSKKGQSILFAHGFVYEKTHWDLFVEYLGSDYRVFRTTIPGKSRNPDVRGLILASYIHWADQECGIPDRELISIGHSIGGVDLRYIVHSANADDYDRKTPYKSAADKLKGVFTIAATHSQVGTDYPKCYPHRCPCLCGSPPPNTGEDTPSPLISPLPYSDFTEQGIQFVAFRYSLDADQNDDADDGRYCVSDQTFGRFWTEVFAGRHRDVNHCKNENCDLEESCKNPWILTQTEHLKRILDYSADPDNFNKFTEVKE